MTMSFSVIKKSPELVCPSGPTPSGTLPLSQTELNPLLLFFGEMVLVFDQGGQEPAKVIREALARALVPYYPVAGRIVVDPAGNDNRLQVACTGEGAWFVEASAPECSLAEVDHIVKVQPHLVPRVQLLPCPPPGIDQNAVSFMMQVTEFKCGGLVVGIKYNHVMFDGLGIGQFMVAIGDMARGLSQPTVKPVWCRELVPRLSNHQPPPMPVEPLTPFKFENCTIDISLDSINQLRSQFTKETGRSCSAFDVVTAKLWQSRTRAINLNPSVVVSFFYPANVRKEFEMLPSGGGYYGNCVFPVAMEAPSGRIVDASLAEIVGFMKDVKESLSAKLSRFLKGADGEHEKPIALTSPYEAMAVTDFRRIGIFETDYGWGTPDHVINPLIDDAPAIIGGCTILNSPAPKKGVRLMTSCVVKEHLEAFREEMKK